jgi:putative ABC transport system substrate-binding protein
MGEGHNDRLPGLIAELVRRQVSVIVTLESMLAAPAARDATHTIPVIFMHGADPVRIGLVDSLSRPGGNLTGINLLGCLRENLRVDTSDPRNTALVIDLPRTCHPA